MLYYTKNGEIVNYTRKDILGSGSQGMVSTVMEDDNICLKEYFQNSIVKPNTIYDDYETRLSGEMFELIKSLNSKNLCELDKMLYNKNRDIICGYTMKYYQGLVENVLLLPIDYIVENFNSIYRLMARMAIENVKIVDLHRKNAVLTDSGIVLIDPDKYSFDYTKSRECLMDINKQALYYMFIDMFKKALDSYNNGVYNTQENISLINSLFAYGTTPSKLDARLKGKKRVLEILK